MQSETLAQEFARLVKEYHEGDDHTKPEAWNLLADYAVDNADAISAALSDKQAREVKALHRLDIALCNFINAYGDPYDPPEEYEAETKRNIKELHDAYNAAHSAGVFKEHYALVDVPVEPDTVFASRHNDETGECETVEIEPAKVRQLREKIAASARRDYDAHLDRVNRATDREIDEATKKTPAPKDWDVWTRGKCPPHREGEDSAKVDLPSVEELVATFKSAVDGGGSPLQMSFKGWPREQGYKILARAVISALAATRSGSATTANGGDHG